MPGLQLAAHKAQGGGTVTWIGDEISSGPGSMHGAKVDQNQHGEGRERRPPRPKRGSEPRGHRLASSRGREGVAARNAGAGGAVSSRAGLGSGSSGASVPAGPS